MEDPNPPAAPPAPAQLSEYANFTFNEMPPDCRDAVAAYFLGEVQRIGINVGPATMQQLTNRTINNKTILWLYKKIEYVSCRSQSALSLSVRTIVKCLVFAVPAGCRVMTSASAS